VQIDAGTTSVGIGTPGSRVDVIMLDEVTEATAAWLKSNSPSIVVTRSPVEPERLIEGVAFVSAETRAVESIFDGTLWEVRASP
jgi:hypothetical protein